MTSTTAGGRRGRTSRRSYGGVALLASALLALGLTGCGGATTTESAPLPSGSPISESPTPAPSSTAPATPQSPFEHEAPVKVLREWAIAVAHDINAHDRSFAQSAKLETATGQKEMAAVVLKPALGRYYPGPVPFTPVAVKSAGGTSDVFMCILDGGFSQDSKSSPRTHKREVINVKMTLVKAKHGLQVDGMYTDPGTDCSGVKIQKVTW